MHSAVYEFLRDQGSIIAGLLALIAAALAGGLTYRVGLSQVRSMREQLEQMKSAAAEHDQRSRNDLLAMFDREASQIEMLATMRRKVAEMHAGSIAHITVPMEFAVAFRIPWTDVEGPGISTLIPGKIRLAEIELRASVDQLNSLIDVKVPTNRLQWGELVEALEKIRDRAVKLQRALGEHGGDRKII
jgi:hypothetical protein